MKFTISGQTFDLTQAGVEASMRGLTPDPVQQHSVLVNGLEYPIKQVLSQITRLPRSAFTSQTAQRVLARLGLGLATDGTAAAVRRPARLGQPTAQSEWAWEGTVQSLFADYLEAHAWRVTGMADTATKARGVDLLAHKGERMLGAEVKGWPSSTYSDPRRAGEIKPTAPTNQAGHWFSQAVTKALMLLDSHPGTESLVVLPDYPRYRDLAARTRTGRGRAEVHVVLVDEDGGVDSETWSA